jgi:hypothetical protein
VERCVMKRSRVLLLCLAAFAVPDAAQAHLVVTGMGPLYDGVSHFGFSPEDYLPIVVLGFFVGLKGARASRLSLLSLTAAWIAGGVMAMLGLNLPPIVLSLATAILFLAIGGLLASDLDVPAEIGAAVAAALGGVRGAADLSGVSPSFAHGLTLIGMTASVFVAFAIATSLTLPLQRAWMVIAARVSGSWLAALGLLLVGWIARYGAVVR